MRNAEQIVDSLGVLSVELSDEHMQALNEVSDSEWPWIDNVIHGERSAVTRQLAAGGMLEQIDNPGVAGQRLLDPADRIDLPAEFVFDPLGVDRALAVVAPEGDVVEVAALVGDLVLV